VLIYNRLKKQDRLDAMKRVSPYKDYGAQQHPGKVVSEFNQKATAEAKHG